MKIYPRSLQSNLWGRVSEMKNPVITQWGQAVERQLQQYFPAAPSQLEEAMAYSVCAGGKRIRPLLAMMTYHGVLPEGDPLKIVDFVIAVEMLHTYSLIHDDLPAMDDDQLRRGKPTNHVVYGEAMAILAGDALQSEAFQILSDKGRVQPEIRLKIISEFCHAVGRHGMVGGQSLDLLADKKTVKLPYLKRLHQQKTGALIRFSARMGALLAEADHEQLDAITGYSEKLGLLFQVVDDLLDRVSTPEELGKTPGKDEAQHKATFPLLLGMVETRKLADKLLQEALELLRHARLECGLLEELAVFIRNRTY